MSTDAQRWALAMLEKGYHAQPDGSWGKQKAESLPSSENAVTVEADLHEQIRQVCVDRNWLPLHGSMAHKTFRTPGEWDFVILAEYPRLLLVECKTKTGKLTVEQAGLAAWASRLGWRPTVCRSIEDFTAYCESFEPQNAKSE